MYLKLLILLLALSGLSLHLSAQSNEHTISGYVEEAQTGERLIGANLFDSKAALGTSTNTYGFFSYTYTGDTLHLLVSYVGYQPLDTTIVGDASQKLIFKLGESNELETVVVTATEQTEAIDEQVQMSRIDVPVEQIKRAPALLGETDVLKTLQLLPGVQAGSEGTAGIYVRGGSPDQNLVMLDGVPVYNVSHVLGIFSVFNADAINNINLTKGGFPARYGGRLSSVLEITMKDGASDKWHGEGGIGIISSRLTVGGPVGDKTRVLVSGRRTYIDLIAKPIIALQNKQDPEFQLNGFKLNFYDLNTKVRHEINEKHRLYLSGYFGGDVLGFGIKEDYNDGYKYKNDLGLDWGNKIAALRWNWEVTPKVFSNLTATFSDYAINFNTGFEDTYKDTTESINAIYKSGIQDLGLKYDLDFVPNPKHYLRAGIAGTHHKYAPGAIQFKGTLAAGSLDSLEGEPSTYGLEVSAYVEDEWRVNDRLSANIGVHFSGFNPLKDTASNTFYTSVQPRVALRYRTDNGVAYKASFASMAQYINLLTSEGLSLPTDLWVPTTNKIKPQRSWQAAVGVAKVFQKQYELSAEVFYKEMENVVSYAPGTSFIDVDFSSESSWEDRIVQGSGVAYGLELFAQKKIGKTTGWVGYTLSKNTRTFDEINSGKEFDYRYDRRHDLSVLVSHDFSKKLRGSAAWSFGTGNAVTLPNYSYVSRFMARRNLIPAPTRAEGQRIDQAAKRNGHRMSAFHRLDLSLELHKKKKWGERAWVFGLYNAYWNRNPFFLQSREKYENGRYAGVEYVEYSILPIIPSFSYKFKF